MSAIDGIVVLDKPEGLTSQDAVTRVKRTLKVKRAGHAGTLDPLATGVLVVCIGEAAKLSSYVMDAEKEYTFKVNMGERRSTGDAEGDVIERKPVPEGLTREAVLEVLARFIGETRQVPPMYSAIRVGGKRLYEIARAGDDAERIPRLINIREFELTALGPTELGLRVVCGKGTYVRVLGEDIASMLGTVAYVTELRRTRIGMFKVEDAARLDALSTVDVRPMDDAVSGLRAVELNEPDAVRIGHGNPIAGAGYGLSGEKGSLRLYHPLGRLMAIGEMRGGKIVVVRGIVTANT